MTTDETPSKRHKREIKPLKASSTKLETLRTDSVPSATAAGEPTGEQVTMETGAPVEREIQGLDATSTRTDPSGPTETTPMVIVDDATPPGGVPISQLSEEGELSVSVLLGELKGLRSRNQILRTERTSMAGRKYALEVVLETLKTKLEELGTLCETLDAPGELGAALVSIREMVGDARRIALGRDLLEDELETERASRVKERAELEARASDLQEQVAGMRPERDSLRERVSWLERDRVKLQEQIVELEDRLVETEAAASKVDELAAVRAEAQELRARFASHEQERAEYLERVGQLEARAADFSGQAQALRVERDDLRQQVETLAQTVEVQRAETERAVRGLEEAVQLGEAATRDAGAERQRLAELEARVADLEPQLARALEQASEAEARAEASTARAAAAAESARVWEARAAETRGAQDGMKEQLEEATGRFSAAEARRRLIEEKLAELEAKVAQQQKVLKEQRGALIEARPMLERLDKDNQRLTRLVGEARARGRVNVEELLQRAELLRRLERIAAASVD